MMTDKILANQRIGILGKGGCGKSTITVLLAKALTDSGYHVCVLDADSTNAGIHEALGFKNAPVSLIEYFGGSVFFGGKVSCPVDDPTRLSDPDIYITKIPQQYYLHDPEGLYLFQLGKIGDKGPGAGCDGPISKITRDLQIHELGENPVTLIDVKAGLEDSARGVITSMDWIISVVDPNNASIQIAADIKSLISQIRAGESPATQHLENIELIEKAKNIYKEAKITDSFVILNKITNKKTEDYIIEKLNEKGLKPIGVVYDDPSISLSWLEGTSLEGTEAKKNIMDALEKLERKIKDQY
jgi:CO dehydrogenase maturation factor